MFCPKHKWIGVHERAISVALERCVHDCDLFGISLNLKTCDERDAMLNFHFEMNQKKPKALGSLSVVEHMKDIIIAIETSYESLSRKEHVATCSTTEEWPAS